MIQENPAQNTEIPIRQVVAAWWPLAASWLLMGLERPAISAVMARLPIRRSTWRPTAGWSFRSR